MERLFKVDCREFLNSDLAKQEARPTKKGNKKNVGASKEKRIRTALQH